MKSLSGTLAELQLRPETQLLMQQKGTTSYKNHLLPLQGLLTHCLVFLLLLLLFA